MTVEKDLEVAAEQQPVVEKQQTDQAEPGAVVEAASDAPETKPEAEKKTFTKEDVDEIVQRRLAKERRQTDRGLRQEVEALKARLATPAQPNQPASEPKRENFEDYDAFVAAQVEHRARAIAREELARLTQEQQRKAEAARQAKIEQDFAKRMEKMAAEVEDFDEALQTLDVNFPDGFLDAVKESDVGEKVAYYLATHRDEAEKLGQMSPRSAIRELGKLEARLSAPATVNRTTKAPAPMTPVSGASASTKFDPYTDDDMEKYAAWRRGK